MEYTGFGGVLQTERYHEAVMDDGTLPVKYQPELVRGTLRQ
jgi:hypothetical protein